MGGCGNIAYLFSPNYVYLKDANQCSNALVPSN